MSFVKESSTTTIDSFPENFRSKLKKEWLDSCNAVLNKSNPGFDNLDQAEKEKLILDRFLLSDMKFSCGGVLPENIHTLARLPSPLILQVNEMVNISDDPEDRRLQLTMTDGVRFISGVETRPIKDLEDSTPAGFKVVIYKACILNGRLGLVPEGLRVLGGMVEDLEVVHKKSVEEVIESPKGERMQTVVTPKPKNYDEIIKGNTDRLTEEYKAMPYTYMASLLEQRRKADPGATIRGKIQGVMTGLSRFKFAGMTEYELVVDFDDGSCNSKVLIHPNEVQRQIGLTPVETSEFLSSISADEQWETMINIEARLSSLHCTLAVELYNNSDFPVAVEVDSSCDKLWVIEKRLEVGY